MNSAVQALIASVAPRRRERELPTHADLRRASDRLAAELGQAGTERGALLDVLADIGPATRLLSSLAEEHRKVHGRTHAVRVAEAVARESLALQYDARPTGRDLPDVYLRTRLWEVVRGIERARVALRWEQIDGPVDPGTQEEYSGLSIKL